jgi:putative ABC transport system substrate-binding protein
MDRQSVTQTPPGRTARCDAATTRTSHQIYDSLSYQWRGVRVRRRKFIALMASTVALPIGARAQQASPIPLVGMLHGVSAARWADRTAGFYRGLSEEGFAEGRNLAIEYRWADGQFERLPAMAADLVSRKVAVICAGAPDVAIRAALAATKTIPIVFTTASDPVSAGFVSSVGRPEGNVTGITHFGVELAAKRLELLRELVPAVARIALLVNPNNPRLMKDNIHQAEAAVRRLGLELMIVKGGSENEVERAIASAVQQQAGALIIGNDAYLSTLSGQIASLALRHALPTVSESRDGVNAGLFMSYGPDQADSFRQAGIYVGRILKGEKAADLPVMQPTKIELFVNLKAAKALNLTVPPLLLARTDEVIE